MTVRTLYGANVLCRVLAIGATIAGLLITDRAWGQNFGFGLRGSAVGGVAIDADGTVRTASHEERTGWLEQLRQHVAAPQGELSQPSAMRWVSLTKLQEEIQQAIAENRRLSEEVLFLAGLQRIEYVFVYPDTADIVLAGPAEPWTVREDGAVVGQQSGRPVVRLEDLITALRTVPAARQEPISVSIEPTPEGQQRLNRLLGQVRVGPGFQPARLEAMMKEAFGPQIVKLSVVDPSSRMAVALVAADYEMKRLAMNLEESPVQGLPSYLELIRDVGAPTNTQPRWWIECDYEAIEHSPDHLAWKLNGRGIKALTEDQFIDAAGNRRGTGRSNRYAERWSELFTEHFDQLCQFNAAFGDLRNIMDLNVVATVIRGHQLDAKAGCDLSLLYGEKNSTLETPRWNAPKSVLPQCSFIRGKAGWIVSASGGVALNPWRIVVEKAQPSSDLHLVNTANELPRRNWWWD
ncbi:MAG: hypothetical protein KatS3mg111_2506 [Pirellulaceae bacterium]|nr:MAG: hypothetical protein KatS3mg111_2506 [Pirellulaceae bacterium]